MSGGRKDSWSTAGMISSNSPVKRPLKKSFICFGTTNYRIDPELDELKKQLAAERQLPDQVVEFLKTTPQTALPIDVLRTAVSMLGLHDPSVVVDQGLEATRRRAISITAKVGVIVAYFHRARNGIEFAARSPGS